MVVSCRKVVVFIVKLVDKDILQVKIDCFKVLVGLDIKVIDFYGIVVLIFVEIILWWFEIIEILIQEVVDEKMVQYVKG